jgi:ABC-type glycerol-3-phosphate transport system permease component
VNAESAWAVLVILAALLTGMLIPTLITLRGALKKAQEALEEHRVRLARVERRMEETLTSVDEAVRTATEGLEHIKSALSVVDKLGNRAAPWAEQASSIAAVVGAVAPAVASTVAAFRTQRPDSTGAANAPQTPFDEPPVPASLNGAVPGAH